MKHHPTFMTAGRLGSWATCSCGWRSRTYHGHAGPQYEFGQHLVEAKELP